MGRTKKSRSKNKVDANESSSATQLSPQDQPDDAKENDEEIPPEKRFICRGSGYNYCLVSTDLVTSVVALLDKIRFERSADGLVPCLPQRHEIAPWLMSEATDKQIAHLKLFENLYKVDAAVDGDLRPHIVGHLSTLFEETRFGDASSAPKTVAIRRSATPAKDRKAAKASAGGSASSADHTQLSGYADFGSLVPGITRRILPGVRNSTLRRIDRWILASPTDKDERATNFAARHVLLNSAATEQEVEDAWDDIFDTMDEAELKEDVVSAIRYRDDIREYMLVRFEELRGKCTCADCFDVEATSNADAGAMYCVKDLDDEDFADINVMIAHNAQFLETPVALRPSNRTSLLKIAEARRSGDKSLDGLLDDDSLLTFFGLRKPHSSTPLHQLEPIRFKDMCVPKSHKGSYLLCRIISQPTYRKCVNFIVEDQDGQAESVCIYNDVHEQRTTGWELDELYPLGQALVIREPTLVKMSKGPYTVVVRIDSPTDFSILPPSSTLMQEARWATVCPVEANVATVDSLRIKGNDEFSDFQYDLALRAYSAALALDPTPEQRLVLALNRAQAYLRLEWYAACFRDASVVLAYLEQGVKGPPFAQNKALLRRASALHQMGQWSRAAQDYERLLQLDPSQPAALKGKAALLTATKQILTGRYDWSAIAAALEASSDTVGEADFPIGDFVGRIAIVDIPDRAGGRGVIATRDIAAGELLLVERPLAVSTPPNEEHAYAYDLHTHTLSEAAKADLVAELARMIVDDPRLAGVVYSLYGGKTHPPSGKLDLKLRSHAEPSMFARPADADIERLEAIVRHNAFNLEPVQASYVNYREASESALYVGAAGFNHSCVPNATWQVLESNISVRARAAIKAGEEVFLAYIPVSAPKALRREVHRSHFGGLCPCSSCQADNLLDACMRDEKLDKEYADVTRTLVSAQPSYSKKLVLRNRLRHIVERMEASYTSSSVSRHQLVEPLRTLSQLMDMNNLTDYKAVVDIELKRLECAGAQFSVTPLTVTATAIQYDWDDILVRELFDLATRYVEAGFPSPDREVRKWVRAAWTATRIASGWGWDHFLQHYILTLDALDFSRFVEFWVPSLDPNV